jgi:cytochrome c
VEVVTWILSLSGDESPGPDEPLPSRELFSGWGDWFAGVWRRVRPANHPGDGLPLPGVHPSFDLETIRPAGFAPRVGGLDFLPDGSLLVASWDPHGGVYRVDGLDGAGPPRVRRIAAGLAEPLGLRVVDGEIFVLQKPELTRLVDGDGDGVIDRYVSVSDDWTATANFHEFAFGLAYLDSPDRDSPDRDSPDRESRALDPPDLEERDGPQGWFYATLATAILPGGASAPHQAPHRGHVVRIRRDGERTEFPAHGLRTPNGVGFGPLDRLYVTDNQGDWLPSSKLLALDPEARDVFFGSRSVGGDAVAAIPVTPPVVWLPQGEIGNSPSEPVPLDIGPYREQLLVADVTHGGLKRVFVEEVDGVLQGAVFRFSQGFEAGLNRAVWGPDGRLYVGGIGSDGNWGQADKERFGLQRLTWNGKPVFEMLAVRARPDGVEIEWTEPVAAAVLERAGQGAGLFRVEDWRYEPTAKYGGPKVDPRSLAVAAAVWSPDRRRVRLELPELEVGRVLYLRLDRDALVSDTGASLWATEAWVTLNALPSSRGEEETR